MNPVRLLRRAPLAFYALVLTGAACNSVTGLDDYEKVDCVGACGDAAFLDVNVDTELDVVHDVRPDVDAADGGSQDADADVVLETGTDADADVVEDVLNDVNYDASEVGTVARTLRWARWRMPHDPASLLDAGPGGPTPSDGFELVEAGLGHFRDRVTLLRWTYTHGNKLPLGEAVTHCSEKSDAFKKVRLPTRIELVTLLEPSLEPPYHAELNDVAQGAYWTQSDAPNRDTSPETEYWVVDFGNGEVRTITDNGTTEAYVRCVIETL